MVFTVVIVISFHLATCWCEDGRYLDPLDFFYHDLAHTPNQRDALQTEEMQTSFLANSYHSSPRQLWQQEAKRSNPGEPPTQDDLNGIENGEEVVTTEGEKDFHAFWSVDSDEKTIRERQANIMMSYIDNKTDPCTDFYDYACGRWASHHPIPLDKNGYGTFELLRESLDRVLKNLLTESSGDERPSSEPPDAMTKAKLLYRSCMNYGVLKKRAEKPLIDLLDDFGGWPFLKPSWVPDNFDWLRQIARLRLYNNGVLIAVRVAPDINNSDEYVIQLDQASLGLLTREDFLQSCNQMYLMAYTNYVIQIATLLGAPLDRATIQANEMVQFEVKLARITSASDERRNISVLCQRLTVGELRRWVPQIDWYQYLAMVLARPVAVREKLVVFAMKYFQDLLNLLAETPPHIVANYLLWRFVQHRVNNLDDRFRSANTRFDYILYGREKVPPRWKSCVTQVNSNMGMALGAMFVKRYFDEYSKNDTVQMTEAIMHSFRQLLNLTTWIDGNTKKFAFLKVDTIVLRIGYPDFILDMKTLNERYDDVNVISDRYFENTLSFLRHRTRLEQLHIQMRVVNKTQWDTAPTIVNGYYSRNKNQIMFPACILQPPFYHRFFPKSLNFGGIGVVIGHEITHGFDDKGRLFDQHGNLHRWWSDAAVETFHQRAKCLIDQYSHYIVKEVNMMVDGLNTQGENIADNGGIKQAFRAYHGWLNAHDQEDERLPGINATPDQLFFLNFAQVWCSSTRPETARNNLKTAVHAPGRFRVIGTLSNSPDFAEAYSCKLGTPMNPEKKCTVW